MKSKKQMGKKIGKGTLIACALAAVMAVGGISAYFTAADAKDNTWTVGNIDIQLLEPQYDESESERVNITPNKELTKDPQIQNKGNNDAFVFLKVTVPKADVKVASQDNQTFDQSMQELFDYVIDGNWSLVKTETGDATDMHVYVYGTQNKCTALAPGATTSVLFKDGKIKFKNVVEGQGLDETTLEMPVEAFAIQTTDLAGNGTTNPTEVWALLEGNTASK